MNATKAKVVVSLGLVLIVAMVFGQTIGHEFHEGDDKEFVYGNPHVRAGLTTDGIDWAFTAGPYGEWYPLAIVSHLLDCQLFGLKPGEHHLTSALLHAASGVLLFLVLLEMTGELWPCALVAAVFAIHPQRVESVAWVAERKDVLSGLFFMLTLAAWLGYVKKATGYRLQATGRNDTLRVVHFSSDTARWPSVLWSQTSGLSPLVSCRYLLVMLLFTLGLLSKPMLVTLPPLLLLLDFWPLARIGAASDRPGWTASIWRPGAVRLVVEKLPLVALAAADGFMTMGTHNQGHVTISWLDRAANASIACVTYIGQMLWPVGLTMSHPLPPGGPSMRTAIGALAIVLAVSAAAVAWRRQCPYWCVGWFWFLGMLAPVLGLVTLGAFTMADRYMYLPGIGLSIALAFAGARLGEKWPSQNWLLATSGVAVILLLVGVGAWQTSMWHDDVTMWRHALDCSPGNVQAEAGLADALGRRGRVDEAISFYRKAIEHAEDSVPCTNFGMLMAQLGRLDDAASLLRRAVAIEPDSYNARVDFGLVLSQRRELKEAEENLRRALELNPHGPSAHYGLARLLLFQEKTDEAGQEFEQAIALNPGDPAIRNDWASVLLKNGKIDQATAQLQTALAIDADCVLAHVNLARALAMQGQHEAALDHCHRALSIDPRSGVARAELDDLLHSQASLPNR